MRENLSKKFILAGIIISVSALSIVTAFFLSTNKTIESSKAAVNSKLAFKVGDGFSDVVPHQIVRVKNDKVYGFAAKGGGTNIIKAYWSNTAGLPTVTASFDGNMQVTTTSAVLSVSVSYDGNNFIHVLANTRNGQLLDFPFDITTNTFKDVINVVSNLGTASGDYLGTSGISSMFSKSGALNIAYWTASNQIYYAAYNYDSTNNSLAAKITPERVNTDGKSNHPSLAISPVDDLVTVAWVSETTTPAKILTRTRNSLVNQAWQNIIIASTSNVWISTNSGINIDQGPSFVIDKSGKKYLSYIENFDSTNDYGKIHISVGDATSWKDTALNYYTHDPALAIDNVDVVYLLGHGHPNNATCKRSIDICLYNLNQTNLSVTSSEVLASPSNTDSFDSSVTTKWSVVGWNRPDVIEYGFFSANNGDYYNTSIYYGRFSAGTIIPATTTPVITTLITTTTLIPITTSILPTITSTSTPVVTTTPPTSSCSCVQNSCTSSCTFTKQAGVTYPASISCSREESLGTVPDNATKNSYCARSLRTMGDSDGDGVVDEIDYFNYVRAVNGGLLPSSINPDFNGDGVVSVSDRKIVIDTIKNAPTVTPIPTTTMVMTTTTMPVMTTTSTGGHVNSAAMGLWNPNTTFDKCYNKDGSVNATSTANIKALHDSYKVLGPDGKWYPTWHPPVATDPATGAECRFGHEHGRDPKGSELWNTKQIQNYFFYDANGNKTMDPSEEAVTGIPFGYANEQLDVYNSNKGVMWMRHEDHVGHKVEYANGEGDIATNRENNLLTGGVNVQNQQNNTNRRTGVKCYYLAKPHQGVSSPDAFTNSVHEVMYFADCRDPNNASNNQKISIDVMMTFGQPGGFTKFMPLCGIERRDAPQDFVNLGTDSNNINFPSVPSSQGDREIITRDCIEQGFLVPSGKYSGNLYEAWPASLKISDKAGKNLVSGINLLFDVEDANRYFYPEDLKAKNGYNNPDAKTNLGFTMDLCYDTSLLASLGRIARGGPCESATNYGAIKDIKWNDPRSAFKGIHRGMYFQPGSLDNSGGNEFVYSDPFGKNAQATPFAGSVKQQISNKKLDYSQVFGFPIDPRVNDRVHDTGKNTVHAPN